MSGTSQMLFESDVIEAVCEYLRKRQFRIIKSCKETEHGIDIEATTPDGLTRVTVEAKGETSSKSFTSRFDEPFSSGQVLDHVSKAFYTAARDRSKGLEAAVAFPDNDAHRKCVSKILPALKALQIEVFWVSFDKTVEAVGNWKIEGHFDSGASHRG